LLSQLLSGPPSDLYHRGFPTTFCIYFIIILVSSDTQTSVLIDGTV